MFVVCGKVIAKSIQEERGDGKMVEEVGKATENAKLKYIDAVRKGDALAMSTLFADDAILLPPNSEIIRGRKGVNEFCEAQLQGGLKDEVVTSMELSGSGDAFYDLGNLTAKFREKGQKPVEVKGKYMIIWKHTASGWKVHRLIWNLNAQPEK
jgi:ketosteroid isomerase-like protein